MTCFAESRPPMKQTLSLCVDLRDDSCSRIILVFFQLLYSVLSTMLWMLMNFSTEVWLEGISFTATSYQYWSTCDSLPSAFV